MTRVVSTVFAVVALAMATASGGLAQSPGSGKSADAPGQARAGDQCFVAFLRQYGDGGDIDFVAAGGGPKYALDTGETPGIGPLNCDHYWQAQGAIGNHSA